MIHLACLLSIDLSTHLCNLTTLFLHHPLTSPRRQSRPSQKQQLNIPPHISISIHIHVPIPSHESDDTGPEMAKAGAQSLQNEKDGAGVQEHGWNAQTQWADVELEVGGDEGRGWLGGEAAGWVSLGVVRGRGGGRGRPTVMRRKRGRLIVARARGR